MVERFNGQVRLLHRVVARLMQPRLQARERQVGLGPVSLRRESEQDRELGGALGDRSRLARKLIVCAALNHEGIGSLVEASGAA